MILIPYPDGMAEPMLADDRIRDDLRGRLRPHLTALHDWETAWLFSFSVAPGDATKYDLVVGYDPNRRRSDGQWLVALCHSWGGADWVAATYDDGTLASLHPSYLAGKIARTARNDGATWGLIVALIALEVAIECRLTPIPGR